MAVDWVRPARRLWYAQYDTEARSLTIRFYLGEEADPADPRKVVFSSSEPLEFRLQE